MPSNVQLDLGAGGSIAATAQISHDGDTSQLQLIGLMGIAGSEDAYTAAKINGDATNGLDVDVTRVIPGTTASALGKAEDVAHASGDVGILMLGVRRDAAASGADTDGDNATLNLDANGRLHTIEPSQAAIAASLSVLDDWDESDRAKVNPIVGQAGVAAGAGAVGATVQRVTLASDDPGVASLALIDDLRSLEDDAHANADPGVLVLAVRRDAAAVGSGTDGDKSTINVDGSGRVWVRALIEAHATIGGATPYQNLDVDETVDVVKGSAGKLLMVHVMNLTNPGAVVYLKLWDDASADIGSDTPVFTFPVPHGMGSLGAGFVLPLPPMGVAFANGITIGCTGASAPLDETTLSASVVIVNLAYL